MGVKTKITLIAIAIALLPAIVGLQMSIDPQRRQFQPGRGVSSVMVDVGNNPVVLPSQFVMGTVIGFREVVAGLLWVRVNDFFHSGNYEAIVPLTRMITWLDPHQIDVYCSGAWHLAYNFVDSNQRADRRYLAPAIKFLEEGVKNNPGVYDPEFDLGFVLYTLKAENFEKGLYWIKRAAAEKNAPDRLQRQVAHAYERAGRINECIEQWRHCVADAKRKLAKNPKDSRTALHLQISKRNLEERLARKVMRADLGKNPKDVGFEASFTRLGPRVFVIRGKAKLPDFARISVVLADEDYREPKLDTFAWQVDPNVTILTELGLHGIVVENGRFERKYDLSKDIKQYPFKKERYRLTLYFNPLTAGKSVQDYTGWCGEGITDSKYLDTSTPGVRMIKKVIYLRREDII